MSATDVYVFYDDVQYIVRGWINRNNILINGQKSLFTISLDNSSANKKINEITIKDDFKKFKKTLAIAYAKAPEKDAILQLIEKICNYPDKNLARFAANSLCEIANYLDIQPKFMFSSDISIDPELKGQDRIIAICEQIQADTYVNTYGGKELYEHRAFEDKGLKLEFIKSNLAPYTQFKNEFVDGLSIIDILMFNNKDAVKVMLNDYELLR